MDWILTFLVGFVLIFSLSILVWSLVGLVVAAIEYYVTPPPPPAAGPCGYCDTMQAKWNSYNVVMKVVTFWNYVGVQLACSAMGCRFQL